MNFRLFWFTYRSFYHLETFFFFFSEMTAIFFFFFCWNSDLYVSVHPQLVIKVFYCFLTYLQEIGLKGKKRKIKQLLFWLCASPLTALSGIYEYCMPVLNWKCLYLYGGLHTVGWHQWFHCSPPPVGGEWTSCWHQHLIL